MVFTSEKCFIFVELLAFRKARKLLKVYLVIRFLKGFFQEVKVKFSFLEKQTLTKFYVKKHLFTFSKVSGGMVEGVYYFFPPFFPSSAGYTYEI